MKCADKYCFLWMKIGHSLTTATCVGIVWLLVESMGRGEVVVVGGGGGNWVPLERSFLSSGLWSIQALHFLVFSDCYWLQPWTAQVWSCTTNPRIHVDPVSILHTFLSFSFSDRKSRPCFLILVTSIASSRDWRKGCWKSCGYSPIFCIVFVSYISLYSQTPCSPVMVIQLLTVDV